MDWPDSSLSNSSATPGGTDADATTPADEAPREQGHDAGERKQPAEADERDATRGPTFEPRPDLRGA